MMRTRIRHKTRTEQANGTRVDVKVRTVPPLVVVVATKTPTASGSGGAIPFLPMRCHLLKPAGENYPPIGCNHL